MQNTIKYLKKLKTDSLFEKKKHYNAATRKNKYNNWLGVTVILINTLTTSVLVLSNEVENLKTILIILSIFSLFLTSLYGFLKYDKQVEGHNNIANKYLFQVKESTRILSLFSDGNLSQELLTIKIECIQKEISMIASEASIFMTNKNDYNLAKDSIENGDEDYLDHELNL